MSRRQMGSAGLLLAAVLAGPALAGEPARPEYRLRRTQDFAVTGDGRAPAWAKADWQPLHRRGAGRLPYDARFKMLASDTGLYVLLSGTDKKLSAKFDRDFEDLWTEDVFEVFLWPDERDPVYFEYEISPLNKELPILVPNLGDKFLGWRPWHYEGDRKVRKATAVTGGEKKSGADIQGWSAEVFLPYALLAPLRNVPPRPGAKWRANVYRVDYDGGKATQWDWSRVGDSFHEYKKFGTLVFD